MQFKEKKIILAVANVRPANKDDPNIVFFVPVDIWGLTKAQGEPII